MNQVFESYIILSRLDLVTTLNRIQRSSTNVSPTAQSNEEAHTASQTIHLNHHATCHTQCTAHNPLHTTRTLHGSANNTKHNPDSKDHATHTRNTYHVTEVTRCAPQAVALECAWWYTDN